MKRRLIQNFIFLSGIVLIFIISLLTFQGPAPVKTEGSSKEFSAYRALDHLNVIAYKPRSMGTEAHKMVMNYIVSSMNEMGLETSIQPASVIIDRRSLRAASVFNIIGVLRGTQNSKAIMIVSHYDSTPHTLGAADDGSGVSAMLETIRTIKELGSFKNDIIFLFTDGEESGLYGARAFVDENKLAKEVGLLLNLEARGSSGPAYTYEVSPNNGWIMSEFFKAVRYPIASSLAYEVYRLMPNSSDFTIFKDAGMSGFNVAFLDDFVNYHSMNDTPETISLRSLQHSGSYAVDIIKHFGNQELIDPKTPDLLYFNVIGRWVVHFPQSMSLFLIIFSSILFVTVFVLGLKRKRVTVSKSLLGILIFMISLAVAVGSIWLLNKGVLNKYTIYGSYYSSNFYNALYYLVAYMAISLAVFSFIYALVYKKVGILNLLFGILFINLLALIAAFIYIPTAIYVSLIPLFFISFALLFVILFNLSLKHKRMLFLFVNLMVLLPVIGFYLPMVKVLFVTFSLELPIAGIALWIILLGLLMIPLRVFFDVNRWALTIIALVVGIIALVGAHLKSDYNEQQPLQSNIIYALNHENKSALWVSNVLKPDAWNEQFFEKNTIGPLTEIFPQATRERLKNKANFVAFEKPVITIISNSIRRDGVRKVKFNLKSMIGAENFQLYIHKTAKLTFFEINGKAVTDKSFYAEPFSEFYIMDYFGWQKSGVDFSLECNVDLPLELFVFEKKLGLPAELDFIPMPASVIPQTGYESYLSLVKTKFVF
ncbi:MAG: M20/M25/M40 family metallo-hydrolase [Bacteroidetes bacterium]|nr:M20/M25/M40 family metallo-hydrolase [Bacteroidota bacterium]